MEVGVRLVGIFLRILNMLLAPFFWLYNRVQERVLIPIPDILLRSARELALAIREEEITSEELVTKYITRIQAVNPLVNAVVEDRFSLALEEAKQVDRCIQEAKEAGTSRELFQNKPLLGVPFTVKESCSLEGLSNAVGCLENAGSNAICDGEAVRLVRLAGAIPLLVSNTPELCLGWETYNLLIGRTNNPFCLNRTAGGSSGGEGALLGCGASPFGIASDIAGSIRIPAAFCGVFGHKPTPGIVSIVGHIPTLSDVNYPKFLAVGPMTRKADDLPLLMNIMAGDRRDQLNLEQPVDLQNLKVHYMTEALESICVSKVPNYIKNVILNAVKYLETECGTETSEEKFKDLEDSVELSVSLFFSMSDIPNMLRDLNDPKREKGILIEIIKHVFGFGSRTLQSIGFTLLNKSNLLIPTSRRGYYKNRADRLKEHMKSVLGARGVLLYPVFPEAAHQHGRVFVRAAGVMYTMVFNVLGLPATTVPMGLYRGLPIAVQVVAAPYQDRLCLAVAKQLEIGFGGWKLPQ